MTTARPLICSRALFLLLVLLSAASFTQAQTSTAQPIPSQKNEQEVDTDDVISVSTTEVLLPVTVRDHSGRLVTDLTIKDFRVFEDGVAQTLSELSLRQVPVDVVLMIDASSSA